MAAGVSQRVAGYIRVSSARQRDESDSPASQRQRLKQAGAGKFFEDLGVSGYRLEQRKAATGYKALVHAIEAGEIDKLLCTRLDRIARRDGLVLALADLCERCGVEFLTLAGGTVSTAKASDWLSVKMQLVIGEHFSRQLSENIRTGYQGLIAAGIPARSSASLPIHLQREPGTRHGVIPSPAWKPCRRVIERFVEGHWSLADAGRFMHRTTGRLSSGKAVAMWLRGRHLVGDMAKRDGTVLIEGCWPAIASPSEHAQIQLRLGVRRRVWGVNTTREVRALSGLIRCHACNRALAYCVARRPSGSYAYLRCTSQSCPSKRAAVRADHLEQALVAAWVSDHLQLVAEAQVAASSTTIPSTTLLALRQELMGREALPPQFRTDQDRQRITELQQLIRQESAAPIELDPRIVSLLDDRLRTVPIDSGWPVETFYGQIDGPPGSPWGWFDGRSEQQRHHDLSLLIERRGVVVDPTMKDRRLWIRGVAWRLQVEDDQGQPLGTTGVVEGEHQHLHRS
jgi:DNA invertase Pin-like site-specific DNA recombinase